MHLPVISRCWGTMFLKLSSWMVTTTSILSCFSRSNFSLSRMTPNQNERLKMFQNTSNIPQTLTNSLQSILWYYLTYQNWYQLWNNLHWWYTRSFHFLCPLTVVRPSVYKLLIQQVYLPVSRNQLNQSLSKEKADWVALEVYSAPVVEVYFDLGVVLCLGLSYIWSLVESALTPSWRFEKVVTYSEILL